MRHPKSKHARWKTELRCVSGPRGVTVSTLDSESSDRGSNLREALLLLACELKPASVYFSEMCDLGGAAGLITKLVGVVRPNNE